MALPLLLSGPVLRRVEPGLVSVWVALSKACSVQLSLFDSMAKAGDTPKISRDADKVDTIAIGDKLHLAVAVIKLVGVDALKPGQLYSYDVALTEKATNQKHDLKSLGLLKDDLLSTTPVEKRKLALGYAENQLPSFALSPDKITDLRIIHGSCRIQTAGLTDGLAWADDLIKEKLSDPNQRIHQLLLAGDQIYADDVDLMVLPQMIALGQDLLANREFLAINESDGLRAKFTTADGNNFPAGMRQNLTVSEARFTTVDNHSHLMAFGEFAAMYLLAWNNELWQPAALKDLDDTLAAFQTQYKARAPDTVLPLFRVRDDKNQPRIADALLRRFTDLFFRDLTADELKQAVKARDDFETPARSPIDTATLEAGKLPAADSPVRASFPKIYTFADGLTAAELPKFKSFVAQLQGDLGGRYKTVVDRRRSNAERAIKNQHMVRRALANVPTYMMWDDHEVTDDWNLNPMWRDRAMTNPLGRAIVRNGMLSFALFQHWGNDPERYTQGKPKRLLELATQLYASTSTAATQQTANDEIELLLGLNRRTIDPARFDDQLSWHFSVPGTRHDVVALDNRTQRNWLSRGGPPTQHHPWCDRQAGPCRPVSARQGGADRSGAVAGAGSADVRRVGGAACLSGLRRCRGDQRQEERQRQRDSQGDARYQSRCDRSLGFRSSRNRSAAQAPRALPKGRAAFRRCPLRVGAGDELLEAGPTLASDPCRFVQFTSSGFKKVMPGFIRDIDTRISRAQRLVRLGINTERMGWNQAGTVLSDEARDAAPALAGTAAGSAGPDPHVRMAARTRQSLTQPDWSWRISVLLDKRPDFNGAAVRPERRASGDRQAPVCGAGHPLGRRPEPGLQARLRVEVPPHRGPTCGELRHPAQRPAAGLRQQPRRHPLQDREGAGHATGGAPRHSGTACDLSVRARQARPCGSRRASTVRHP